MAVQIGDKVPEFLGTDQDGKEVKMSDYKGKKVALYFYPKDNTSGCTAEACSLRDGYQALQAKGFEIIGVRMTQDEIAVMDGGKCILQLRGVRPFFSDKFDITKHPRYKYLADADKKNTFDIERYMKRRPAIVKPDEPFDLYELKATDLQPNNSTERKEM